MGSKPPGSRTSPQGDRPCRVTASDELPADVEAERYLLGAIMTGGGPALELAAEWVGPDHFYRPAHQVIYGAMIAMVSASEHIDPVTLRAWIDRDGDLQAIGGFHGGEYLMDLYGLGAAPQSAGHYGRIVLGAALRRNGIVHARRAEQAFRSASNDPEEVIGHVDAQLDALRRNSLERSRTRGLTEVTTGIAKQRATVIPGLLEAQDRVIVVAGEGRGKTTVAHQIAFAAAAGTHPFAHTPMEPQRVMIWDFENPELLLSRRFNRMAEVAAGYPGWDPDNMRFELRPGGITSVRDVFALRDGVRRFGPDLLIAGPLYKMMLGSPGKDGNMLGVHSRVAQFFDQLRQEYGCALWLEAHAPYGGGPGPREMRPEGSSMWARWPEFGLALYKATKAHGGDTALDVKRFRGDREEGRVWPDWLTRNPYGTGWPWVACYGQAQAQLPQAPPPDV
jgi:hypothetical protein